jgi:hypothetical protein
VRISLPSFQVLQSRCPPYPSASSSGKFAWDHMQGHDGKPLAIAMVLRTGQEIAQWHEAKRMTRFFVSQGFTLQMSCHIPLLIWPEGELSRNHVSKSNHPCVCMVPCCSGFSTAKGKLVRAILYPPPPKSTSVSQSLYPMMMMVLTYDHDDCKNDHDTTPMLLTTLTTVDVILPEAQGYRFLWLLGLLFLCGAIITIVTNAQEGATAADIIPLVLNLVRPGGWNGPLSTPMSSRGSRNSMPWCCICKPSTAGPSFKCLGASYMRYALTRHLCPPTPLQLTIAVPPCS